MSHPLLSHHLQRWITGLYCIPLLLFVIYSAAWLFSLFILIIIQIAVWEYNRLVFGKDGYTWEKGELYIFAAALAFSAYLGDFSIMTLVMIFCLLLSAFVFLLQVRLQEMDMARMGKVVLGFMYIPLLMSAFIMLRQAPQGVKWVILTLILAFCGDIFGYYTGKIAGKRKLYARVSPGKTVEGTIGLLFGSILGGVIFQQFFFRELLLGDALILGAFGGMLGQLGDLFESALKRSAGVKDAGSMFPGHGGILDRLDSLSFIAPFIYYYERFILR